MKKTGPKAPRNCDNSVMPEIVTAKAQTPMLKQYLGIKSQYPDAILFFRLGDFYEMFYEDATEASGILDIALTSRNKKDAESVPLCGVPYHSVHPYIAKLLSAGKKVAICEQMEDPSLAKGVVRREVVRVITPGMVLDESVLEADRPNYSAALFGEKKVGLAVIDISTGYFTCGMVDSFDSLANELLKLDPKEILIPKSWEGNGRDDALFRLLPRLLISSIEEREFSGEGLLLFEGADWLCKNSPDAAKAAGALWHYTCYTQKGSPPHVTTLYPLEREKILVLDEAVQKNLELLKTQDGEKRGSLLHFLDRTLTPMGARKLRGWLLNPLLDLQKISERQEGIELLLNSYALQESLAENLKAISDLERLVGRVAIGTANARDLLALGNSLKVLPTLKNVLEKEGRLFQKLAPKLEGFETIATEILRTISEAPPLALKDGGLIQSGIHTELDELRAIQGEGKGVIARLEAKEKTATGISSLKVKYNRVFGYYIEITHTHREKVPLHYIRKQTLVNAERYITPELKEIEEKVLGATEKIQRIEYELFVQLRNRVAQFGGAIQQGADAVATADVLFSLAKVAAAKRWTAPQMTQEDRIEILEGRHPIVEELSSEQFVSNDLLLDDKENRFLIITGPNMAGKSTVMRQVALIVILAQIGSYVPATKATIGLRDKIFTRVGASDRLARGESTFMVEMTETAHILRDATPKSLIIVDEIGRGTSTYDGVAIAWAVAEYIHNEVKAMTLFATHYHELIDLPQECSGMKNFNIAVKEWNDKIIFLRKLVPGGTSRSYGVEVAKLAGLPQSVITKARQILEEWESFSAKREESLSHQMSLFVPPKEVKTSGEKTALSELRALDFNQMTPIQALEFLATLKEKIKT